METLEKAAATPAPAAKPSSQMTPTPSAQPARSGWGIKDMVRIVLALSIILAWAILPLRIIFVGWLNPAQGQQFLDAKRISPADTTYFRLLMDAKTHCPPDKPMLMLTSGADADQIASYYIYPRRVDLIGPEDPITDADFDAHADGCLALYGDEAMPRLDPFRSRLKELKCAGGGCLYDIQTPR
jgi:hypothetical protein